MNTLLLAEVLPAIDDLPSLPSLVLELLATMENTEVETDRLARKIALDQALSARTLRLANSSFYAMPHPVGTIAEAMAVLGLHSIRNLALTAALADRLKGDEHGSFDFMGFWRHAIGSALGARAIAAGLGQSPEQAYTAGLLHDVGRLVLATRFPSQYSAVRAYRDANDCYPVEAEQAVLGLDQAMVGEALARHWRFPVLLQEAVAWQHAPDADGTPDLAVVVHVADAIAHALGLSRDADALVPRVSEATWRRVGLDGPALARVLREVEHQFEAACSVLEN